MRIVVTGGGTGGHVYPALEVAKAARDAGVSVTYVGSSRGQEQRLAPEQNFEFKGFPSAPLYSLRQPKGWRSLAALCRATVQAKAFLRVHAPDAIFSTGGFSAAPVMGAARSLKIPLVIHESNTVPGRSNRLFAPRCFAFTCAFQATCTIIPNALRTGQPIRQNLRRAAENARHEKVAPHLVLALGGSQGSLFINDLVERASEGDGSGLDWLIAAGKENRLPANQNSRLKAVPYLDSEELADAYSAAAVAVARSGGTLAELALFAIPSILIPLPISADQHQLRNAEEFVAIGGAALLPQTAATPEALLEQIDLWIENPTRYASAQESLRVWDRPNATGSIWDQVLAAAKSGRRSHG